MTNEELQNITNGMARSIRKRVVTELWMKEYSTHNITPPSQERLEVLCKLTYDLPCTTRQMQRLFDDAHDLMNERGEFDKIVSVSLLEWCLEKRCVGYASVQSDGGRFDWLPKPGEICSDSKEVLTAITFAKKVAREQKKFLPRPSFNDLDKQQTQLANVTRMLSQEMKI